MKRLLAAPFFFLTGAHPEVFAAIVNPPIPCDFKISDPARGVKDCTEVIQKAPKDSAEQIAAYMTRGEAYGFLGKYQEALSDFTVVITRGGTGRSQAIAYSSRGQCYSRLGKYADAIGDFDLCIGIWPENPVTYDFRSKANLLWGKPNDAEADARAAISKEGIYPVNGPWLAGAWNLLGYALFEQDRWDEAAKAFEGPHPAAEPADKAHALLGSAFVALRKGDRKKALTLRNQAEALRPKLQDDPLAAKSAAAYKELLK